MRLHDDLDTYWATSESKPYVVGPMAMVELALGFSVEVDAPYRGLFIGEASSARLRRNSWEFPMLLRKTVWRGVYVQIATLEPRTITHLEFDIPGPSDTANSVVLLRIAPEVRYVFWNKPVRGGVWLARLHHLH